MIPRTVSTMALAAVVLVGAGHAGATTAAAADSTVPTATAPVARIQTTGQVQPTTVPFTVTWSGADASGIRSYRLQRQVDGGSWDTVPLASATATRAVVGLRPPHEYAFRVRATDRAGNVGAYAVGPTFRVRRLGERTSALSAGPGWAVSSNDGYLDEHALRSGTAGATATLTFTGSQVAWFGTTRSSRGTAEVSIDGTPVAIVDQYTATSRYRVLLFRRSFPTSGPHDLTIRVLGTSGHPYVDIDGFVVVDPPARDPVLVGAGDIAVCGLSGDSKTAALLDGIAGRVFAAGDNAYPNGSAAQYRDCYGPTWGRWKSRTSPVPGNHEYNTPGAAGYFAYFGSRAGADGTGWYAYDLGTWRVYSLNSNCTKVGCGASSAQVAWLTADLAANPRACVAAIWHHPRFSSGEHGDNPMVAELWAVLEDAGAEIVLNGHDHSYERFEPQTGAGVADPDGLAEFVVGTGGASLRGFPAVRPNSAARNSVAHGVLRLTLHEGSYDWRFVPVAGASFADAGSATCH